VYELVACCDIYGVGFPGLSFGVFFLVSMERAHESTKAGSGLNLSHFDSALVLQEVPWYSWVPVLDSNAIRLSSI
jgi:hypothetical protein